MTSTYDFYLFYFFKIICLNIFLEPLHFVYITFKLSILFNYAKHLKKLVLCYTLLFFIILKSLYSISQPAYLEKDNFNLRKNLFCIKNLDFQDFYQLFIL